MVECNIEMMTKGNENNNVRAKEKYRTRKIRKWKENNNVRATEAV